MEINKKIKLEGWDGVGGGRRFKKEGHMYTHGWFMLIYGRNQHNHPPIKNKLIKRKPPPQSTLENLAPKFFERGKLVTLSRG